MILKFNEVKDDRLDNILDNFENSKLDHVNLELKAVKCDILDNTMICDLAVDITSDNNDDVKLDDVKVENKFNVGMNDKNLLSVTMENNVR